MCSRIDEKNAELVPETKDLTSASEIIMLNLLKMRDTDEIPKATKTQHHIFIQHVGALITTSSDNPCGGVKIAVPPQLLYSSIALLLNCAAHLLCTQISMITFSTFLNGSQTADDAVGCSQ